MKTPASVFSIHASRPRSRVRLLMGVLGIVGAIGMLWGDRSASAAFPMGVAAELGSAAPATTLGAGARAFSTTITCTPMALWNPDAGVGLVRCGSGYSEVNVESETTTEVKFVHRYKNNVGVTGTPVTRADLDTYGMRRKVGGNNGSSYRANIANQQNDLFCVTQADAGVTLAAECAQ